MRDNAAKQNEIIRVEKLVRNYGKSNTSQEDEAIVKVLKELNFNVEKQEFVGIMGKSGCGKTTLLKVLGLIDKPTKGNVFFEGKDTEKLWEDELADIRRQKIGFVFQDFYLLNSLSVRENIMLPMVLDKQSSEKCMENGENFANLLGLNRLLEKYPNELSGGEKQRVSISRALINNPDLILADEPTGNLDSKTGKLVIEELENINQNMGKTIIMVTHDPQMASYCTRVIFLKDGMILKDLRKNETRGNFYTRIVDEMQNL